MPLPFLEDILAAYPSVDAGTEKPLTISGEGELPSWFDVTGLATASIGAAGLTLAQLAGQQSGETPKVSIDQRHASFWFGFTVRPQGWEMPPSWDPIAGDYRAKDRWIRLHTNAPHHRDAALRVLACEANREAAASRVATWAAADLEHAVVAEGGCAAEMRDPQAVLAVHGHAIRRAVEL